MHGLPNADLEAARGGDTVAFERLVAPMRDEVYHLAYHLLRDVESALEACQEALLSAWQGLRKFRGDVDGFRPWFIRILVNSCHDRRRSMRHMAPASFVVEFETLPDLGQSVEEYAEQADLRALLARCLGRLPEEHREILLLDHMGFKYREIAEILALEVGTVRSRLSRARARMRDLLLGRAPGSADPRELFGFGGRLFKQDGSMGSEADRGSGQEAQS